MRCGRKHLPHTRRRRARRAAAPHQSRAIRQRAPCRPASHAATHRAASGRTARRRRQSVTPARSSTGRQNSPCATPPLPRSTPTGQPHNTARPRAPTSWHAARAPQPRQDRPSWPGPMPEVRQACYSSSSKNTARPSHSRRACPCRETAANDPSPPAVWPWPTWGSQAACRRAGAAVPMRRARSQPWPARSSPGEETCRAAYRERLPPQHTADQWHALSAYASGFLTIEYGRRGAAPTVETAYVTSEAMDGAAQAHPSE